MSSPDFVKVCEGLEVDQALAELCAPEVPWGARNYRKEPKYSGDGELCQSPHLDMTDLWIRYNKYELKDTENFNEEHTSVWYPEAVVVPSVVSLVLQVCDLVRAERLGGVFVTKLPPGGKIERHVDSSWHSHYYDKFMVAVQNDEGADFCWDSGVLKAKAGDVWRFENDVPHWVENNSDRDRIVIIISIRTAVRGLVEDFSNATPIVPTSGT